MSEYKNCDTMFSCALAYWYDNNTYKSLFLIESCYPYDKTFINVLVQGM